MSFIQHKRRKGKNKLYKCNALNSMCYRKYLKCHVELVTYTVPSELHATNDLEVKSTDDFILVRVNHPSSDALGRAF